MPFITPRLQPSSYVPLLPPPPQAAVLLRVLGLSWDNPLVGPGIYTEAQVDDILDGKMTDQANLDYAMIPPPPIKRLLIDLGESKSRKGNKTCILVRCGGFELSTGVLQ